MNRFLASIGILLIYGVISQGAQSGPNYDGRWWLSISKQERLGFFEGYATCYLNDTDGKLRFAESGYTYEPRLTEYLHANPTEQDKSIEDLLWKMAAPPYARRLTVPEGGETVKGKYGYLDGDYWRQNVGTQRLRLIQGFLYCYSKRARVKK